MTTTVRPTTGLPIGIGCMVLFFGWLGWTAYRLTSLAEAWWFIVPLWGLAAFGVVALVMRAYRRRSLELTIAARHFHTRGITVHRSEVTNIRRYKDLTSDGVRVQLTEARWLDIPVAQLDPSDVLAAFRSEKYPVEGTFL